MITKVLGFSGRKQSGKTTSSNFIHGYQLRAFGIVNNFCITDIGALLVDTDIIIDGKETQSWAELNTYRRDSDFAEWASYHMWPYVKNYSFAEPLKYIAVELFGINREQVYGSDEEKNSKTHLKWENMPFSKKKGKMTSREFMQHFGTNICRNMHQTIWTDALVKTITTEEPLLAVVDDCRFENEIDAIHSMGGKVIRLTRNLHDDDHDSEKALDTYEDFDKIIDNQNMTIHETNVEIIKTLEEWGWLKDQIANEEKKQNKSGIQKIKG